MGAIMNRRASVKFALRRLALAIMLVGLWGFLPSQDAQAQSICYDYVTGLGTMPSQTGAGKAAFGFAAGYASETAPLAGFFTVVDRRAGFSMRTLTVTQYGGFHCGVNNGDPCWDRFFSGDAQVNTPTFSGVRPYMVEVIDWGADTPSTDDYIHISGGGYVNVSLLNRGNISIHNASTADGCQ
jgi:hypothetical protein